MADTPERDNRTEEPTQRRLDQAIERGDVAKSQEINTLFVLGGLALAILVLSGPVTRSLALDLRAFLMNAHLVPPDGAGMTAAGRYAFGRGSRPSRCRSGSWRSPGLPAAASSTGRCGRRSP